MIFFGPHLPMQQRCAVSPALFVCQFGSLPGLLHEIRSHNDHVPWQVKLRTLATSFKKHKKKEKTN